MLSQAVPCSQQQIKEVLLERHQKLNSANLHCMDPANFAWTAKKNAGWRLFN